MPGPSSVLFVCLGNICRSPMAEVVLRRRLGDLPERAGHSVESRATSSLHLGKPADPRAVHALQARGYAPPTHTARQITDADFSRFELIVGMDRGILRTLQGWVPADFSGELRLLPGPHGAREIEDPYSGGEESFARALREIEAGIDRLLAETR